MKRLSDKSVDFPRTQKIREITIKREQRRRILVSNFHAFIKAAWHIVEPSRPFQDGWHIVELAMHAKALKEFYIDKLVVNMPPRHMKSSLFAVMFPAWVWADPKTADRQFIFASYAESIALRDSGKTRELVESEWYRNTMKINWKLKDDQNQKKAFENTAGGKRIAVGVGTGLTGHGADHLFIDDPHNALDAQSQLNRDRVHEWFKSTFSTRYNNAKKYTMCVIMQRLHEDDLAGRLLEDKRWEHLVFQARYKHPGTDDHIPSRTVLNPKDPRDTEDSPLWPQRFDSAALLDLELTLEANAEGQLQQDPKPPKGGLFPRDEWQWYQKTPSPIIELVQFWDCAEKPGITNDYSVCSTWARGVNGFYLLDLWRDKVGAPQLQANAEALFEKWKPTTVVIEDKSHGSALIQYLLHETTIPVIPYNPGQKSKELRAIAASPTVKAGKCHLPVIEDQSSELAQNIKAFVKEHEKFPKGKNDDTVDTTSMMVSHFNNTKGNGPNIRVL